ncbi:hypothetical protein SAMN06297422_12219 [Lachnospiraceae bacterium]|nr:hypothetical protein SAMN06297422_12219 [Lachnospiraceae bacterium]
MNKKTVAVVLEIIPIVSAVLSLGLTYSNLDSGAVRVIIMVGMALAFFGFVFFLIGRKLAKEEKIVRILGIFDLLATASIIGFYILVFIALGS